MIQGKCKIVLACMLLSGVPLCSSALLFAQQENKQLQIVSQTIRGTVKDKGGEPMIGAIIKVVGTNEGTTADLDGNFEIKASGKDILSVSYLGYETLEVPVKNQTNLKIVLSDDAQKLDEVIVIGYGTTTRKRAVSAVDQVKSTMIEDRPVANVTQALQGATPSLTIQQRSMDPNDNTMNINIRGVSTMNNNSPLIVIDGLVSDDASLNKLNPSDIANISVLKDAGSAAIYGSRSSNGVILVTTKSGKKNQKPTVRLGMQLGAQDPKLLFSPVAGYQNAILKNLSLTNVGKPAEYTPAQVQDLYDHRSEEYWNYDKIMKTALQQSYDVNVTGGSETTTYMFSAGYFNQESNYKGPGYGKQRYNLRSNISTDINDRIKLSSILAYTREDGKKTTDGNAIINSTRVPSYYWTKMQADNGKYLVNNILTDQNPLASLKEGGYEKGNTDYINLNLNLEIKIIDGLKLRGIMGADIYDYHRFIRKNAVNLYREGDYTTASAVMNPKQSTEDYNENKRRMNYQLLADYQKTFNEVHNLSILAGATNESYTFKSNEVKFNNTNSLGIPSQVPVEGSNSLEGRTKESITSILGRVSYNFMDRYYAEFSFREDGSSKFAKGNRWGFFPSGSLGWRASDESFMTFYKEKIGDLKFRVSYGILGNQNIDNYSTVTTYSSSSNTYAFDNAVVGGAGFNYGDANLKWEKSKTLNIGVDATFLDGALSATFDYFHKTTSDILLTPQVPSVFGTTLKSQNIGEMKNHGWEVTVNYFLKTGDFSHNFTANVGDTKNKVTKLVGGREIKDVGGYYLLKEVGLPFNSYYGYKTDGYFSTMEEIESAVLPSGVSASDLRPGDVKYVDRNGDGVIDEKDRYVLGNGFPRYTFGFTYNVEWKGFDFSMFWQGVGKRDMMVRGELIEPYHENYSYTMYQHQLDYWTETNTGAKYPRLTAVGSTAHTNNFMGSDLNKLDGKYLRLKNIQIGYTLPKSLVSKLSLSKVHAYLNAQNLFTLSKNSWIDPESSEFNSNMSGNANSARSYPVVKYYGFGLNIEF